MEVADNSQLPGGKPIFVGALERAFPVLRELEAEGIETHSFHLTEKEVFGPFTLREVLAAGAKADLSYARKRFGAEVYLGVYFGELFMGTQGSFKDVGDSPVVAVLVSEDDFEKAHITLFGTTSAGPFPGEYGSENFVDVNKEKFDKDRRRFLFVLMALMATGLLMSLLVLLLMLLRGW